MAAQPQKVQKLPVQELKRRFYSPNPAHRRDALFRAVNQDLQELAPDILEMASREAEPATLSVAAWALGKLGYKESGASLLAMMEHANEEVRIWSVWALGELGVASAEATLAKRLAVEELESVKRAIGGALKKLRLEPTRVHIRTITKALRPPSTPDILIKKLVSTLEGLRWPEDSEVILALREKIQRRDPEYFQRYMRWMERKPFLTQAAVDRKKVYRD